nr:MAG TPA: hypothetical protein [Caudoviricetes sp.]
MLKLTAASLTGLSGSAAVIAAISHMLHHRIWHLVIRLVVDAPVSVRI